MGRSKKKNNNTKVYIIIASIFIIIASIVGSNKISTHENYLADLTVINENEDVIIGIGDIGELPSDFSLDDITDLQVMFFDVGQADSILISDNGQNMLIDAGNYEDGEYLVEYLKQLGITKINYLIGTHAHEDHIGGMNNIINEFDIEHLLLPTISSETTTKAYKDMMTSIENKELDIEIANIGDVFYIGDTTCTIKYVDNELPNNLNNSSIIIEMFLEEEGYLFMGDSEKTVEKDKTISWNEITVLKVGHHGSDTSSSDEFIKAVSPKIAIISVGKDNIYKLPKESVINRLKTVCGEKNIFRTDEKGTIYIKNIEGEHSVQFLKTNIDSEQR